VSISFSLLYIAHMWMMIGPLQFWCGGNTVLYLYSTYTLGLLIISIFYALEMPIFMDIDVKIRWIPIIFGLVSGGLWVAQCIY